MLTFDLKRCIAKKHLLYILIVVSGIFLINATLEYSVGETSITIEKHLVNLSQAIFQFSIVALLPILADTFSVDYQLKNSLFFLQNSISGKRLYLSRVLIYDSVILMIYLSFMIIYFLSAISFNLNWIFVIGLNLMIVLASTNVIMTISLLSKKRWQCILLVIAIWIFAIIINLIPIKGISGFFLPVDGASNVAQYLLSLTGDIPAYKNLFLTIPLKVQLFLCCFFWMIIPVILGSILAPRCIQRNSL